MGTTLNADRRAHALPWNAVSTLRSDTNAEYFYDYAGQDPINSYDLDGNLKICGNGWALFSPWECAAAKTLWNANNKVQKTMYDFETGKASLEDVQTVAEAAGGCAAGAKLGKFLSPWFLMKKSGAFAIGGASSARSQRLEKFPMQRSLKLQIVRQTKMARPPARGSSDAERKR